MQSPSAEARTRFSFEAQDAQELQGAAAGYALSAQDPQELQGAAAGYALSV